ncbi:MAG: type II toxin-antitoxin system PemK/MazF family toxin [Deltaproteobacteria bacterium]|nr:type II toxin-antitoxin system PemK/MazF family toxin [Deltaproteobacteria bacterium]
MVENKNYSPVPFPCLSPFLVIRQLPGQYDDWLICMISSQLYQRIPGFDEVITSDDSDFKQSGLKLPSVIRISRIAVVEGNILLGKLGQIDTHRLFLIKQRLSQWLQGT